MERQATERDDTGGIEHRSRVRSVFEIEPTLERRSRLGQLPHPQQQAAAPGFEHLVGPALPVALGRFETVGGDLERVLMAIEDAEQLTVPHVCEAKTLVIPREDSVAVGCCDEIEGGPEAVV